MYKPNIYMHHPEYLYLVAVAKYDDDRGYYKKGDRIPISYLYFRNDKLYMGNFILDEVYNPLVMDKVNLSEPEYDFVNPLTNKKVDVIDVFKNYNGGRILFTKSNATINSVMINNSYSLRYEYYKDIRVGTIAVSNFSTGILIKEIKCRKITPKKFFLKVNQTIELFKLM